MLDIRKRVASLAVVLVTASPTAVLAQRATPAAVTGARAFAAEALGGTIGSALGLALGLALTNPGACPAEDDVVCPLQRVSLTGVIGIAGAAIGTTLAGNWAGTKPSLVGALLGAAAGTAVGIGLEHLITEEMSRSLGEAGTVILFSVAQGVFAAAGSRIVALMRNTR
ncbi:MAG: hypothetical protein M3282_10385 [Gemmatimonadota bacterium]|nr:hypothetical protein [Gemmatimonadota bacterium]